MHYDAEMAPDSDEKKLRVGSFAVHATRGIVRDRSMRRRVMLGVVGAALLMVAAGSTFLRETLNPREHAARYILFWFACAWLTLSALLLAVFDALVVRSDGRAARRSLREQAARAGRTENDPDEDA